MRAEYDFVGLNNRTFVVPAVPATVLAGDVINTSNRNFQMVTAGLSYEFGPLVGRILVIERPSYSRLAQSLQSGLDR